MTAELPFPTAILLDWDGTIVDSVMRVHNTLQNVHETMGIPAPTVEQSHQATIYGPIAGSMVFGLDEKRCQEHLGLFNEKFCQLDGQIVLLDGVEEFILNIPPGIPAGVVSNAPGEFLREQIAALGWQKRFGAVVGAWEASQIKPFPDPAFYALKKLGVPPSRSVWFVGDTRGDIECAHAAGLTSILLSQSEPTDCTPHHRFTDCTPIRKHFSL